MFKRFLSSKSGSISSRADRIRTGLFKLGDDLATEKLIKMYWNMWQFLEGRLESNVGFINDKSEEVKNDVQNYTFYAKTMQEMIERRASSPAGPRLEGEDVSIEELLEQATDELQMMRDLFSTPQ